MRISDYVKGKVKLSDVFKFYTNVSSRSSGDNYFANCPYHTDKTPSVSIRDNRGSFKCFSCGRHGDHITLVQEMEHLDFVGALKFLIDQFQIKPPERLYKNEKRAMIKRLELEGNHGEAFKILMEDK